MLPIIVQYTHFYTLNTNVANLRDIARSLRLSKSSAGTGSGCRRPSRRTCRRQACKHLITAIQSLMHEEDDLIYHQNDEWGPDVAAGLRIHVQLRTQLLQNA